MPGGPEGAHAILGAIRNGFADHDAAVLHVQATGRRATIRAMDVVRCEDGAIAEHWGHRRHGRPRGAARVG